MKTFYSAALIEKIRAGKPLIHCLTNYVTANDCANILLACGASPIMADAVEEAADIASLSGALVLNIGTLNSQTIPAFFAAGKTARQRGIPILLDPVGAGASALRTETALQIIREIKPQIIRGNISEIKALALGTGETNGVDAASSDLITEDNLLIAVPLIQNFAKNCGAVVGISGPIDLISDGQTTLAVYGGDPLMPTITGSGCMLSVVTAVFAAAESGDLLTAAATAFRAYGICGEIAAKMTRRSMGGPMMFRQFLIDETARLTPRYFDGEEDSIQSVKIPE